MLGVAMLALVLVVLAVVAPVALVLVEVMGSGGHWTGWQKRQMGQNIQKWLEYGARQGTGQ